MYFTYSAAWEYSRRRYLSTRGNVVRKIDKCPELEKVCTHVDDTKPIPQDYVEHAKRCLHCMHWLSYSLALRESFFTTRRMGFNEISCPERIAFKELIFDAIRSTQTHPFVSKKAAKDVREIVLEEIDEQAQMWGHLKECKNCYNYYYSIYEAAARLQEKYEMRIRMGFVITPYPKDVAEEISFAVIDYMLKNMPDQKWRN
jgi:hypothetical protein